MKFRPEGGATVTDDEKERIREAIRRAANYGYDLISCRHRFFIVDNFYDTDFRKNSKNPIQKSKFFNLAEMLDYSAMRTLKRSADDVRQDLGGVFDLRLRQTIIQSLFL